MTDKTENARIRELEERLRQSEARLTTMIDTENALRISEEKFLKAFKLSPDAININRMSDGVYVEINDSFTAITGYTEKDVLGRSSLPGELGIWDRREDRDRLVDSLKKNGKMIGLEAPFRCKDGSILNGIMSAHKIEINGEMCILSITRDISGRKQQEDALRESEKRYRELANSLPLAVFEADIKGLFTFVNRTGLEWFGYTDEDIQAGMSVFQTIDPKDRSRAMQNMRAVVTGSPPTPNEYMAARKNGSVLPVLIISSPIIINGKTTGIRGITLDIAERKRMESALQNQQKIESLGIIAGGIAHDFNNLLTGLFGHIDLALQALPEGEARENINNALSVFSRAKALTQQLLTFAKGGLPVKKTISISELLKETVNFALSGSNIKASFDIQDTLWKCDADPHQIGQVIDNIIINARQAMPQGGPIRICACNVPETEAVPVPLSKRHYVKITIQDSGGGIPPDIVSRIFEPFFTTKQEGSGLGLATSYSIISKHDGHIYVESQEARGTTVTIFLPVSTNHLVKENPTHVQPIESVRKDRLKILFLDDEISIRHLATIFLKELGCSVTLVSDGSQAIEEFRLAHSQDTPFDLVILDLTIPGGTGGIEALEEMSKIDPAVKAVASSGYSENPILADPKKYGFIAKLSKPYIKKEFMELMYGLFPNNA